MIFNKHINIRLKNHLFQKEAKQYLFAEPRMLCKKQRNPEAPTDGTEDATEGGETSGGDSVEKTKADTSEGVHRIAGKQMDEQQPLDIRPDQPVQKPSVYRHLKAARKNAPTIGEAGKAAITGATILVPPAALAVGAAIGVRNLWQRFRGVPKEQRVGLSSVGEGIRSLGKTVAAPFRAAGNVAKFGLEATGRTLNTVVGGPIRGVNKLLKYRGSENKERHLLRDAVKGTFGVAKNIAMLPVHIVKGGVKGMINLADDLGDHPIKSALGGLVLAGTAYAVILQGPALGAAALGIVEATGKVIGFIPTALKWMMGIPPIPGI